VLAHQLHLGPGSESMTRDAGAPAFDLDDEDDSFVDDARVVEHDVAVRTPDRARDLADRARMGPRATPQVRRDYGVHGLQLVDAAAG
jgi:hypothetical protein